MTMHGAFQFMVALGLLGVGVILLACCLAIAWVVLASARRTAGEIERGER